MKNMITDRATVDGSTQHNVIRGYKIVSEYSDENFLVDWTEPPL